MIKVVIDTNVFEFGHHKTNPDVCFPGCAGRIVLIRSTSTEVFPTITLKISDHESDNRFYECAEAAQADYLITGNTAHFSKDHKTTKVVTPRDFIVLISPLLAQDR